MYIEGSVPFFRVEREGGVIVEEKRLGQSPVVGVGGSFSFSLPPANYVLVTYVRPCDGTCEHLDPPADECRGAFSIKSGQTLYAVRQQTDSGACSVTFSE
jgi:hypothetical protein